MCGILLIDSKTAIAQDRLDRARHYLRRRGPNHFREWQTSNWHVMHAALHVTGDAGYYHATSQHDFCAFAGEIYNYRDWNYTSDAHLMHDTVRDRLGRLRQLKGPSSWIYATGDFVCYATDPQGERHLYRYEDRDLVIVASEPGIILCLVDDQFRESDYLDKTWSMLTRTPYQHIQRLESGRLYINHESAHLIDSVFDWVKPGRFSTLEAAVEEFDLLWTRVMQDVTPPEPVTISYSGGIDSSLISHALPDADLLSLDIVGKDPNIAMLQQELDMQSLQRSTVIPVTVPTYAGAMKDMMAHTGMPAQSWSHVSKWLIAKHAGHRIVFTGSGADELFGGYDVYADLTYSDRGSTSPYSARDTAGIWSRCLQACQGDPQQATLLCDYVYQVVGMDSQGWDRACGAWSRECRHPFMHPDIVRFALSLPVQWRVCRPAKPILRESWSRKFPSRRTLSKQGFAGHANDAWPWLNIDHQPTGDRLADWQDICVKSLYAACSTN